MSRIDLPRVATDIRSIEARRDALAASARAGTASRADLDGLATTDAEAVAFDDMCRRSTTRHLMSTGLRWGDDLRHPALPGLAASVRLRDLVGIDGAEMTIAQATRKVARRSGRPAAIADWSGASVRLGDALGLEHPPRGRAGDPEQATLL